MGQPIPHPASGTTMSAPRSFATSRKDVDGVRDLDDAHLDAVGPGLPGVVECVSAVSGEPLDGLDVLEDVMKAADH